MRFTKGVVIVVGLFYIFLWVLAFNGVTSLRAPLAVPLVLAVLVALGVRLNRFMGIAPRRQHFEDSGDPASVDREPAPPTPRAADRASGSGSDRETPRPAVDGPA